MLTLPQPAPDFRDPLGLLAACHGRIESRCATLMRLPDYLAAHGCDTQVREAAAKILRYFSSAAKHHHRDEEEDLFPRLLASARARGRGDLPALLDALEQEHRALDRAWAALEPGLEALAAGRAVAAERLPVGPFVTLNSGHLAVENRHILPFAREVLNEDALAALGQSMARRRGALLAGA